MKPDFYTEKRQVQRSFDRAAASYDAAAVLQREVNERMLHKLEIIRHQPQLILDVGSGTGYGARALRQRFNAARVLETDLAPGMLLYSRDQRARGWRRWFRAAEHVCADMEALPFASNSVDMLWSNLALQWCNEPDTAFAEMLRVLKPGGLLMFSTFGPDTLKELKQVFASLDAYTHVNRFIDMHDLGDAMVRAGYETPVMDMDMLTLTYSTARAALADLKAIGAHNVTAGRPQGLMGRQAWQRMVSNYETLRRADGLLPLTFEVVYGHAWKPQPKADLPQGYQPIQFKPRA